MCEYKSESVSTMKFLKGCLNDISKQSQLERMRKIPVRSELGAVYWVGKWIGGDQKHLMRKHLQALSQGARVAGDPLFI